MPFWRRLTETTTSLFQVSCIIITILTLVQIVHYSSYQERIINLMVQDRELAT